MTQTNHKKVFELLVPQSENNFSFCNLLLYSDPSYANFYALSFVSLAYPFFCELRPRSWQAQNKALATSGWAPDLDFGRERSPLMRSAAFYALFCSQVTFFSVFYTRTSEVVRYYSFVPGTTYIYVYRLHRR